MLLLEKLNTLQATVGEHGTMLAQVRESTSSLELNFRFKNKVETPFCPTQPSSRSSEDRGEAFIIPKGGWVSINYFMTLPFVADLTPAHSKFESIIVDNSLEPSIDNCKLPNIHPPLVQELLETYLSGIHPLHPVLEIATIERIKKELDEDGLSWNGETAIILLILAIARVMNGHDSLEYHSAAKRRLGFAVETINHMSIQAHYLQGYHPFMVLLIQAVLASPMSAHSSSQIVQSRFNQCLSLLHVKYVNRNFLTEGPSKRTTNTLIWINGYSGGVLKWKRDMERMSIYLTAVFRVLNL